MKITLYQSTRWNYTIPYCEDVSPSDTDMVRTSEPLECEFAMLEREQMVAAQLQSIEDARKEVSEKFYKALKELDDRKAALMALTQEII